MSKMVINNELLKERQGKRSRLSIAKAANVAYYTLSRYMENPALVQSPNLDSLYNVMTDGLGFTPAELSELKVGELFIISEA